VGFATTLGLSPAHPTVARSQQEHRASVPDEAPPPDDVKPTHYALVLEIVSSLDRFSGIVDIDVQLDRARDLVWLHGSRLVAKTATVTPQDGAAVNAKYAPFNTQGLRLRTTPRTRIRERVSSGSDRTARRK
jgi:hypothetical protein